MAEQIKPTKTVYSKDGKAVEMYAIDAHNAVTNHPKEWSFEPFDGSEGVELPNGEPRAVIPNDWVDLKASEKISLAHRLGAPKDVRTGAAAEDFINRYLIDRANAGAAPAPEPVKDSTTEPKPD